MPDWWEIITENFESSIENLNIEHWENVQMTNTLRLLNWENQLSFYRIEWDKVVYDMETVKKYLTHICKKEDWTLKTWEEMTDDIWVENLKAENWWWSTIAWTTAVQIALEYLWYDVWKIDWNKWWNTEKAIKKYQRNNNLEIDWQPWPEVIHCLLNDFQILEDNKEWWEIFWNKLKEFKLDKYFNINSTEWSIEITDILLKKIEKWFNNAESSAFINDLQKIIHLSDKIQNTSWYWAISIEFYDDDRPYNLEFFDRDSCLNQIYHLWTCLKYFKSIKSVKLVPNYYSWYDAKIVSIINTTSNYWLNDCFSRLHSLGITMEDSRKFLDKYMETKNITNFNKISNSNYDNFFDEEMDFEMIKFLFWENNDKIKLLLPIKIFDGLKFYKLKCLRWENKFKRRIINMINSWLLTKKSKKDIWLLIDIEPNDLQTYFEICNYFQKLWNGLYFHNLDWYSPDEYLKIIKYMGKYSIDLVYDGAEIGEILYKNNIPKEAIQFFYSPNIDYNNYNPVPLFKEIFENENWKNLFMFLSKYPQKLQNLWWKEIKEIELTTKTWWYNFCFRGILEMIKSIPNMEVPDLKNDGEPKWKQGREKIIKMYEDVLRNYISLDKDNEWRRIPREQTFDKIFFANALNHKDEDDSWVFQWESKIDDVLMWFTENFEDCSSVIDKNWNIDQSNQKTMIKKIREYAKANPNKKILVCVDYHWGENWASTNGWKKEDRINLASISPNIKIISTRCYFWCAYNYSNELLKNHIYSIKSPVSWFSNLESSIPKEIWNTFRQWVVKKLWFHELELYTRLHYKYSFSPLTDFVDYTNFNTGEKKHWKIWLADAWDYIQNDGDVHFW